MGSMGGDPPPHIRKRYHYEFTSCFSCFLPCFFYGAYLLMNEMERRGTFEHVIGVKPRVQYCCGYM